MKIQYFQDTDTLYIEFNAADIVESKAVGEDTVMDVNSQGHVCALTVEHASERTDVEQLITEGIAA